MYNDNLSVSWEHIVPAYEIGKNRECWNNYLCTDENGKKFKGRKCCRKIDAEFKEAEADLHNLQPAVHTLNLKRSNLKYGITDNETEKIYGCDFKISGRTAEPPENIRGDIARTYFYMIDKYNIDITPEQLELFKLWDEQDKVSEWERKRNELIFKIQGNRNKFIK